MEVDEEEVEEVDVDEDEEERAGRVCCADGRDRNEVGFVACVHKCPVILLFRRICLCSLRRICF